MELGSHYQYNEKLHLGSSLAMGTDLPRDHLIYMFFKEFFFFLSRGVFINLFI